MQYMFVIVQLLLGQVEAIIQLLIPLDISMIISIPLFYYMKVYMLCKILVIIILKWQIWEEIKILGLLIQVLQI